MIHLIVDVHVHKGACEQFIELATDHAAASRAETGCHRFEVLRDLADPCHFALIETWFSAAHLYAHRKTPHYAFWRHEVQAMETGRHVRTEWQGLGHTVV